MKPAGYDVLIEPMADIKPSSEFMIIGNDPLSTPCGKVLELGLMAKKEFERHFFEINIGDVVMYQRDHDTTVHVNGVSYTIVKAQSIIGTL